MSTTRSSVPPVPAKKGAKGPGPLKAGRRKPLGKKPDPDRNKPTLTELKARQPFPGRFSDTYPEATDEECEGRCDCWGDNNPRLTREEQGDDAKQDYPYLSQRGLENTEP